MGSGMAMKITSKTAMYQIERKWDLNARYFVPAEL